MIDIGGLSKGAHVIDVACGKGKTSAIREFILTHYNEGILYCVDTREELYKMYNFLLETLVRNNIINTEDIMIITSESKFKEQLKQYRYDPYVLTRKKILLITHVRFFTSLINYFLVYKPLPNEFVPGDCFDGNFDNLLQKQCLRQWVFFDETPMWIKSFWDTEKTFMYYFMKNVGGQDICKSKDEIFRDYKRLIKNNKIDPFKHDTKLDRIKRDSILSMIPRMFNTWINTPNSIQEISISFKPRDLVRDNINTHILFFEGAADLILEELNPLKVQGKKYNSTINFIDLGVKVARNDKFSWEFYRMNLEPVIDTINFQYAAYNRRTLVVVWKSENSLKDKAGNNNSDLRDAVKGYIKGQLIGRGLGPEVDNCFDVIYYGENKCKSTNEFKDYENIVLYGKWFFPNTKTYYFNMNWNTEVHPMRYNMWFYVQLISRIGIRRHDGGNYNVYFTNDFLEDNNQIIKYLDDYFNRDIIPVLAQPTEEDLINDILATHNIKRIKEYIIKLCHQYPRIKDQITNVHTTTPLEIHVPEEMLRMIILEGKEDIHRNFGAKRKVLEKALNKLLIFLV